jgi:kynurenine formamidase
MCVASGAVVLCVAAAAAQQRAPQAAGSTSSTAAQQAAPALQAAPPQQPAGGSPPLLSPGAAAARYPRNLQEFDELFNKVKNWGRWGENDQLGAANLITDDKRRQAIALAKRGIVVGLAHPPLMEAAPDNANPFNRTMNRGWSTDTYSVSYHGYAHSHIDALCHILYKDQTYNGHARADVLTENGCRQLGVENLRNGVVTRGVLIDMPRLKKLPWLEPGTPVFVEDLEAWEKEAKVKIGPGDAIFLRTGRWARREKLGPWNVGRNEAGYHASVAPWLKERGVSFLGSDDAQDVTPSLVEGINLPVHTLAITALGIDILDNQDLEALAETAARLNRWEFLLTVAPVPVTGGTGFPANALAIF